MKKILKKILAYFGLQITRIKCHSVEKEMLTDAFTMQKYLTKDVNHKLTIFDIGAYDGGTALAYKKNFPNSKIYSFEPFPDSFAKLVKSTSQYKDIIATNKGVGNKKGVAKFNSNKYALTNSLLDTHELGNETWGEGLLNTEKSIEVELTTIDEFVETNNIKKIDILKMDVQGAEYMVMEGAKKTIEQGQINMIYTEIITVPTYKGQLHFDEMIKLMRAFGFTLFNLYNLSLSNEGELRQVDAIFLKSTPQKNQ